MMRLRGLAFVFLAVELHPLASLVAGANLSVYDEAEAVKFLELARVSFCDDNPIRRWKCGKACKATKHQVVRQRVELIGPGESWGVKGYSAELRDVHSGQVRCVLAYRGSVNMDNWLADAKIMLANWPPQRAPPSSLTLERAPEVEPEPAQDQPPSAAWCPGCQVHGGFAEAYEELRNETLASLRKLGCEIVDVTGHSLGAGVATLAAMDLRATGIQIRMLWTFGSPRVGNAAFVKAFMAQAEEQGAPVASWRVVHYHDPVPQGGPSEYYVHVPRQVFYTRDSSSHEVCPPVKLEGDEVVRPDCGMYALGYRDISGGLIKQDHVNYLNRTLALKDMDAMCVHLNYCTKEGRTYSIHQMVWTCLLCSGLAAALTWWASRSLSRKSAKGFWDLEEEENSSESSTTELSYRS